MCTMEDQTKNDSMGSLPSLTFWMIFCITYFFLVGIREIIFKQAAIIFLIGILVCLFLGAFIAAFILKWVEHKWVLVVGGVLVIIGRLVLLYPETASFISSETIGATGGGLIEIYPWYYIGNGCIFLGFNFFVVSLIGLMGKWKQTQKFSAEQMVHLERGIIPAFLFAFGFNLLSRLLQILHSPSVQILLAVISLIVLMQWNHAQPERFEATQGILIKHHWKQEQHAIEPFPPKTKALGRNIILIQWSLLSILLYLPLLHPELLAYQAGIPYHWMQVILFVTIGISAIVVFILMPIMKMNRVIYRKIQYFLCIANTLILILFGSYLYLPPGQPAAILIYIFTFIIVGVDLGVITQEFWAKRSQVLEISAAIVLFLSNGLSTGLRILLLQAHVPFIWYPILGVIVGINIIQAFKVRAVPITQTAETKLSAEPSHKVPIKKDKAAIALCFLVLLPTLACSYYITKIGRAPV